MIDREDREVLGRGLVLMVTVVLAVLILAATAAAAIRLFEIIRGL